MTLQVEDAALNIPADPNVPIADKTITIGAKLSSTRTEQQFKGDNKY